MIRRHGPSALRVLALAALLAVYALVLSGRAGASSSPLAAEDCARIGIGEAGWDPATGDAAAITHLLQRRADRQGLSLRRMARLYSSSHFDEGRTHRRWVVGLTTEARRPPGWPSGLPWRGGYRELWLRMLEHVRAVLRGEVPDPCPGADHWGGAMDDWRAERAGWERVDCSTPTRNHFWRVPRAQGAGPS